MVYVEKWTGNKNVLKQEADFVDVYKITLVIQQIPEENKTNTQGPYFENAVNCVWEVFKEPFKIFLYLSLGFTL